MNRTHKLLVIILLFSEQFIYAQNESFKAIFIYNFTKYIEWPSENQSPEFIITVLGDHHMVSELESVAKQHKVNSKQIVIKFAETVNDLAITQIVFVTKDKGSELAKLVPLSINKHILIITEKPNACSLGSGINFLSKNGNLSFEIHRGNIQKSELKVNSQLFNLGTAVQ